MYFTSLLCFTAMPLRFANILYCILKFEPHPEEIYPPLS